jgi:hypothetical protein
MSYRHGDPPLFGEELERLEAEAAAYSLEALDPVDMPAYLGHLTTCAYCRELVNSYREAASQLASLPETAEGASRGRSRLLRAARAEPMGRPASRRLSLVPAWSGWVAAAAVLVFSLGIQLWPRPQPMEAMIGSAVAQGGKVARIEAVQAGYYASVVVPRSGDAWLVAGKLPALAPGQVYQVWGISGQSVASMGVMPANAPMCKLEGEMSGPMTIAITVEPGPNGSPAPSGQPFLAGVI